MTRGFVYWYQGLLFIFAFMLIVGLACFFVAFFGSKMINDLGNFPSKSAKILVSAGWKLLVAEIFAFALMFAFYNVCIYLLGE